MARARRHLGWMTLTVVAGGFALGAVVNMLRAVFDHAYGVLVWGFLALLFWYWITIGAYRRAIRPSPSSPPPD